MVNVSQLAETANVSLPVARLAELAHEQRSDNVGAAAANTHGMISKAFIRRLTSLPESRTNTSRVGALYFL